MPPTPGQRKTENAAGKRASQGPAGVLQTDA